MNLISSDINYVYSAVHGHHFLAPELSISAQWKSSTQEVVTLLSSSTLQPLITFCVFRLVSRLTHVVMCQHMVPVCG